VTEPDELAADRETLRALWEELADPAVLADRGLLRDVGRRAGEVRERTYGPLLDQSDALMDFAWRAEQLAEQGMSADQRQRLVETAASHARAYGGSFDGLKDPFADVQVTSAGFSREAGFGRRILAYLIDYVVVVAAGVALAIAGVFVYALFQPEASETDLETASLLVYYAGVAGFALLYFTVMEGGQFQATIGKLAVRLATVRSDGGRLSTPRAFVRSVVKVVSSLFRPLFLVAVFSARRRAIHDMLAGSLVVRKV
jgi:uncharacterized RDD family membrane protein YckC